jgi:hexosaminidase
LCAGKTQTLQFAKDVMDEIMDIFPSEYIHIGGDECPTNAWKSNAQCQALLASLNSTN